MHAIHTHTYINIQTVHTHIVINNELVFLGSLKSS